MPVAETQRVMTRRGPVAAKTLAGPEPVDIWDGAEFRATTVSKTPSPVQMLVVELSDGTSVRCTPDQTFYIPTLAEQGAYRRAIPAAQLHRGIRLARTRYPALDPPDASLPNAYAQGVYSVWGREGEDLRTITCRNPVAATKLGASVGDVLDMSGVLAHPKSHVPVQADLASKRAWLSGLLDAMGVRWTPAQRTVTFRDQEFVKEVANLLLSCGIPCSLRLNAGDVAVVCFSAAGAGECDRFLGGRGGTEPDDAGGARTPRFRLLSASTNPLLRQAKRHGPAITVRSVAHVPVLQDGYSVGDAVLL